MNTFYKNPFVGVKLAVFDFDGVFTDNTVYVDQNGTESVRCWRSDGLSIERLRETGIPVYIISTEENPVVAVRAKKLKILCVHGIKDKAHEIQRLCKELNIDLRGVMFVGNDINDLPALKLVGYPVGVADCYPEIDPFVIYKTKRCGGKGAVREVCDILYAASSEKLTV